MLDEKDLKVYSDCYCAQISNYASMLFHYNVQTVVIWKKNSRDDTREREGWIVVHCFRETMNPGNGKMPHWEWLTLIW